MSEFIDTVIWILKLVGMFANLSFGIVFVWRNIDNWAERNTAIYLLMCLIWTILPFIVTIAVPIEFQQEFINKLIRDFVMIGFPWFPMGLLLFIKFNKDYRMKKNFD